MSGKKKSDEIFRLLLGKEFGPYRFSILLMMSLLRTFEGLKSKD